MYASPSVSRFADDIPEKQSSFSKSRPSRRSTRVQHSRATRAQPRRVNKTELDAEDQIIVQMKEAGHSDEVIRDKLIALGMTVYVARSIATRYGSLKKAMAEREDQILDDELTDWHEGEVSSRLADSIPLVLTKIT